MTDTTSEPAEADPATTATESLRESFRPLTMLSRRNDIALALGIICILVVLLLPMPTWMLDFSLALSITFSVII